MVRLALALLAGLGVIVGCSGDRSSEGAGVNGSDRPEVVTEEVSEGSRSEVTIGGDAPDGEGVDDEPGPLPADTLVWIVGTEPPDLHLDDPINGLTITSWIRDGLLDSLFDVGPDLTYRPELLAVEPTLTANEDKSVVIEYRLRSGLTWSDGTPLTAEDVAYTHRILTEGCRVEADGSILDDSNDGCIYRSANRVGLDQITAFEVTGETSFTVTMAGFYPDWRRLFSPVLAAHAYGDDATQVNQRLRGLTGPGGPLPVSGPLRIDRWERGRSMTLVRNEAYHGPSRSRQEAVNQSDVEERAGAGDPAEGQEEVTVGPVVGLEAVRIDFEPDLRSRVEAVVEGRADLLIERLRPGHAALVDADGVAVTSIPGEEWEHWGLNLLNPHLALPAVRQALAYAIDKPAVIERVYRPLVGSELAAIELGNTYWLASQPAYEDHQQAYGGAQVDQARAALAEVGYQPGADGVYQHPDLGRLSLRVSTPGGDPIRESLQVVLIDQLAAAGIEAVADNAPGGTFFQSGPFDPAALVASATGGSRGDPGLWDVAQFSWAGGSWPGGQSGAYRNGSPGNPYGFSNAEFEVAAFECDALPADDERADCYNQLDLFVTTLDRGEDGLFIIPALQRPLVVAHFTQRWEIPSITGVSARSGPLVALFART